MLRLLVWVYGVTAIVPRPGKTLCACKGLNALQMNRASLIFCFHMFLF